MSGMQDHVCYTDVVPDPRDGIEVTYRNGKLYYLPYLVEKFHWWHEALEIPKPWTAEAVFAIKDRLIEDNMCDEIHSRDCQGCPHEFRCNMGDVKTIMRMLGVQECLPGVAHRHDLIPTEQPGRYDRKERMYGNA